MTDVKKKWYIVQAFSGYEAKVAKVLREYIKLHDMEDVFGDVLVLQKKSLK
jgi:transcriptional antiterminator NusG